MYLVTAADLRPVHREWDNKVVKFADDTYVIVPAENDKTCATELSHVKDWAERNNLRLNCAKTNEIVFRAKGKRGCAAQIPPPWRRYRRRAMALNVSPASQHSAS